MRGEMVILGSDFDAWVRGFEELAEGPSMEMRAEWTAESEQMFADSQAFAHIDTGYNKSTGTVDVDVKGRDLGFVIDYAADYAIYEHARGADHAFLTLAYERTDFPGALERGFVRTVRRWK